MKSVCVSTTIHHWLRNWF